MSIHYMLSQAFGTMATLVTLIAAGMGLAAAMRYPHHPLSRTRAVGLARAGFGCLLGTGLLRLVIAGLSVIAPALPSGGLPVTSWAAMVMSGFGLVAGLLGAAGIVCLALSTGEFMKLGTGQQG